MPEGFSFYRLPTSAPPGRPRHLLGRGYAADRVMVEMLTAGTRCREEVTYLDDSPFGAAYRYKYVRPRPA
jgi:hypothetical protein